MTDYTHERIDKALDALEANATDREIADLLGDYFTHGRPGPFDLSINHLAKLAPCPLRIDRAGAKACFVKLPKAIEAKIWIVNALIRAYEVTGTTWRGVETRSIAGVRRSIASRAASVAWRARVKAGEIDDEVPF